jgi:hypothetical protein
MNQIKQELKSKFISQMGDLNKGGRVLITYPSSTVAKYMALYDINDILDNITNPENVDYLSVENTSSTPSTFKIKIPPTINKFSNLTKLVLTNCIDYLPEEIGGLNNLEFLTVNRNPGLTKLPDSLANLENISFVNLQGSDNIILPDWWKTVFETYEGVPLWYRKDIE